MKGSLALILFGCGFYLATLTSCQKEFLIPNDILIPDTVSFSENVIPIFSQSCVDGCHETGKFSPDLDPANAYSSLTLYGLVDTAQPEQSILYQRMISTSNVMPPEGKLVDSKVQLVLKWIEQGARNN